ncbi:MAG: S49 family peptidase [Planctomycetota bacterium]
MWQRFLPLLVASASLTGCCGRPLHLVTDSRVAAELAPQKDGAPLAAMPVSPGACDGPRIALIDVDGLLLNANMTGLLSAGENPVAAFREKLDQVAGNRCYCGVVVRINSPGGGVTACDVMRRDLIQFRAETGLPVTVCLMDLGAGGAYYLATAADHIVAHPTTITGGIGVILNLYNLQDTMAQVNIEGTPIKSGKHVDLGTPIEPMDAEARNILQRIADEFHARFRIAVQRSRNLTSADDSEVFDGRIFTAPHALELGLIDSIGYVDDALSLTRQCAGCPAAAAVVLHRPRDQARTIYDVTPNAPLQGNLLPFSLPGLERSRLPTFLYLWQPEPTLARLSGK